MKCFLQNISYHKHYGIDQGIAERDLILIEHDDEGFFWLLFDRKMQIFDGKEFYNVQVDSLISLQPFDQALMKENSMYIIDMTMRKLLRLDCDREKRQVSVTDASQSNTLYRFIGRDLYALSIDTLGHQFVIKKNNKLAFLLSVDSSILDVSAFHIHGNRLFTLSDDGVLSETIIDESKHIIKARGVKNLIGIHHHELWFINQNFEVQADKLDTQESRIVFQGVDYASFYYDDAGNKFLACSKSRYGEKTIFYLKSGTAEVKNHSHLTTDQPYLFCFYGENFEVEFFTGNQSGFHYFKTGNLIKSVFRKEDSKSAFPNPVMGLDQNYSDSSMYFAIEEGGLFRTTSAWEEPKTHQKVPVYHDLFDNICHNFVFNNTGTRLFSSHYKHPNFYFGDTEMSSLTTSEFLVDFIFSSLKMRDEKLWIYGRTYPETNGRILIYDPISKEIEIEYRLKDAISNLAFDDDSLYLGSSRGLSKHSISDIPKVQSDFILKDIPVKCIVVSDDKVLIGTAGFGLYVIDETKDIMRINRIQNGLCNDYIEFITEDQNGYYWLGTRKGLALLDENCSLLRNFYSQDGLSHNEFNRNVCQITDDGILYAGTLNGLTYFNTQDVKENLHSSYQVHISDVGFVKKGKYSSSNTIPYNASEIRINLSSTDFDRNQDNAAWKYLYELDLQGLSDSIEMSDNTITIHKPKSGSWNPEMFRKGDDSRRNLFDKEIKVHNFFTQYVFFIITALLFFGLLFIAYRERNRSNRQQSKLREAQFENDNQKMQMQVLRSQMNPHFMFNSLSSIQYFVQINELTLADRYLAKFGRLMRLILESSRNSLITIREEIELIRLYVEIENMRFDHKFDYEILVDPEIDLEFVVPPMILQPFIENSIIHGINLLTDREGLLYIRFSMQDHDTLQCVIEDNGVGRHFPKPKNDHMKKTSRGTEIVNDRVDFLKHIKLSNIDIHTDDLISKDGQPAGTKVTIRIREQVAV